MNRKLAGAAVLAVSLMMPLSAGAAPLSTTNVHIVRTAGTCPASIAVVVTNAVLVPHVEYHSGYTIVAKTSGVATGIKLVSATPKRIEFSGDLDKFATCRGTGHKDDYVFGLDAGMLHFVINNHVSTGGKGGYPGLYDVGVNGDIPHATLVIAE